MVLKPVGPSEASGTCTRDPILSVTSHSSWWGQGWELTSKQEASSPNWAPTVTLLLPWCIWYTLSFPFFFHHYWYKIPKYVNSSSSGKVSLLTWWEGPPLFLGDSDNEVVIFQPWCVILGSKTFVCMPEIHFGWCRENITLSPHHHHQNAHLFNHGCSLISCAWNPETDVEMGHPWQHPTTTLNASTTPTVHLQRPNRTK